MREKIQFSLILVLTVAVGALFYLQLNTKTNSKIGFVRSQELIYQYDGMLQAIDAFEAEQKEWRRNLDTLQADYEKSLRDYQLNQMALNKEEQQNQEQLLTHQYSNLVRYAEQMEDKLAEQEETMLEGVLNQVNAFSGEFALENEIDLLITTANSGNILYGEESLDYTEDLLVYINKRYNDDE